MLSGAPSVENYGSYQLLKRLATGGMAQIYLARQTGLEGFEKLLVVKRILPHLAENEDFVKMFLDEARIAARLNHSNIVQIFNLGAEADTYFIAMEYIHGEDVRRVWKRAEALSRELPVALACRVVMEVCSALDYAHKKLDDTGKPLGIVHRDISPQNVIITFEGGVKLVDFGIAKAADQSAATRSGVLKGKYSYMSPEQAAGDKLDSRSDIFALGVVTYELLTATRLFKRPTDIQTINAVMACEVMPPSQVNSRCPQDLDPIVMKALSKRREDRYQDAQELQLALEGWLLTNQLPSSSAQLAGFMREIYADKLAKEARAGGPQLEEGELQRDREEADPKPVPPGRTGETAAARPSMRVEPSASAGRKPVFLPSPRMVVDAPSVTIKDTGGPPEMTVLRPQRRPKRRLPVGYAAAAIAAAGALGWFGFTRLVGPSSLATVHVVTEPTGATVIFAGHAIAEPTPCTLPRVEHGGYEIEIGKAGYQDYKGTVNVPDTGDVTLPLIRLDPQRSTVDSP